MNEARKQVFNCIDYCGDIISGAKVYNPSFSPNNIRTVVISLDGIYVRLHTMPKSGVKGVSKLSSKSHFVSVNPVGLYTSGKAGFNPAREKSMLEMLVSPLVCANIEEIIILKAVSTPQYTPFLNQYGAWEFDYNMLVDKKTGSLQKDVGERFPRLHYITEANIPFKNLLSFITTGKATVESVVFLTDLLKQYVINTYTFNEEWYDGSKLLPNIYPLDRMLPKVFNERKGKMKGMLKEQGFSAKKVVDQITFYCNMVKEIVTLPKTAKRGTDREVIFEYNGFSNLAEPVSIIDTGFLPANLKSNPAVRVVPKPDNVSASDVLSQNSNAVLMAIQALHDRFVYFILKFVHDALTSEPTTAMGCLYNCEYFYCGSGSEPSIIIPRVDGVGSLCYSISDLCPIFQICADVSSNYRSSIAEWIYFFVNFNYTGSNPDSVSSTVEITQRLNNGVTDSTGDLFKSI